MTSPQPQFTPRLGGLPKFDFPAGRLLAVVALTLTLVGATRAQDATQKWAPTWAVSQQTQEAFLVPTAPAPPTFSNVTLRQVAHTSLGGSQVRVRFSNLFGTSDLVIGAAHVAYRGANAEIQANSDRTLTFGGRATVTIPVGALAVSDPVTDFIVPARSDLAVSIFLPNATLGVTTHTLGQQTNYVLNGNQTATLQPAVASTLDLAYYFLTDVETLVAKSVRVVATIGDSITDGYASTPDTNHRWPNFFAARLAAKLGNKAHSYDTVVADQGISGNRLYHNIVGPDLLSRFDRDVTALPGVTDVIMLIGINDIGFPAFIANQDVSADDLIAAYRQIIARAHEAGLRIYGCTLTPFAVTAFAGYFTDAGEAKRQAVNAFVRTGGAFDGIIDFSAATTDGQTPEHFLPQYDSGDHLHPNDAGYQAMANAINLKMFKHLP